MEIEEEEKLNEYKKWKIEIKENKKRKIKKSKKNDKDYL